MKRHLAIPLLPIDLLRRSLTLCASLVLVLGCAGQESSGVGGQGTGVSPGDQYGTVSGLGSVIVEGNVYQEVSGSTRRQELDPANPTTIAASGVRLGMQTQLSFESLSTGTTNLTTLTVLPTLLGVIDRVAADTLTVAGQTVLVLSSIPPVYEGLSGLSELVAGDRVEVHGLLDQAGRIVATRLERVDPAAPIATRLTGIVTAVALGGTRLTIGDLLVDITGTTQVLPSGTSFTVNRRITVYASTNPVGGRLSANTVMADPTVSGNSLLRAGGVIRELDRVTGRMRVGPVQVDLTGTITYVNGNSADLANGAIVRVRGQASAGLLRATEVTFIRNSSDTTTEVTGLITDLVSTASFKVRQSAVDASASTVLYRGGTLANLTNGALVKIEGKVLNGILRASRVEFITTEDTRSTTFRGTVSDYNPGTGSFVLLGVNMRLAPGAVFSSNGGGSLPRSNFSNGDLATVSGSFVGGVFSVTAAVLEREPIQPTLRADGLAYSVNLTDQTLLVNGQMVRYTSATRIDGSLTDLRSGVPVRVEGSLANGVLIASRLSLRPPSN